MKEPLKIMIVDDEFSILQIFKEYLEATTNYNVIAENNGLIAIEIIKQQKIDCCFLDISMPEIDGIELAKQIHLHDNTIPIVMITGHPTAENAIKTLKNGVVDFLTKPFEMSKIQQTIQRVMKERELFVNSILLKEATEKNREIVKINLELQQKLKEVEVVNLILQKLENPSGTRELLNTLVQLAAEITKCDEVYFCIFYNNHNDPTVLASYPRSDNGHAAAISNIVKHNIKKVADEGIPLIIKSNNNFSSTMAVPLKIKSNTFGILVLFINDNARYFINKDLYYMNFLLNKASSLVENQVLYENIFENLFSTLYAFVKIIEAKDPYTKQHSHRVSLYARLIGSTIGCSPEDIEKLNISGILHDIGKIGTPDSILLKPGKLTDEEYDIIKKHPGIGSNIIGHLGMWFDECKIIHHHHERFDGRGYPDGLKGEDIPMLSRILSVADVYDALTSDRSYRKKMENNVALTIIKENTGSQFDPKVVDAFFESYNQNDFQTLSDEVNNEPKEQEPYLPLYRELQKNI
ncbi:MAG: response regulator [Desulfobacterium sp.]|nr:response regulator [Desulfobacterium sp.]MBU3949760.1 response regulator [Pseudomonadota bacterium]MBU4010885.1 response regulator [Pseudomonadota bacterium]MBU4036594.1 response regulator [Pseudomonadota bacterium]